MPLGKISVTIWILIKKDLDHQIQLLQESESLPEGMDRKVGQKKRIPFNPTFVSGSGSSVSGEVGLDQSQGPKEIHFEPAIESN